MEASTDRDAPMRSAALVLGLSAVILFALDQLTKALVVDNLRVGQSVELVGDLVRIWHVRNTGAAFSLLPGALWLFLPVTALAIVMIAYFFRSFRERTPWIHLVLGLILAGSLGNLADRLRLGYVVDFISVGISSARFPTFNLADSAVVVGIGLLVIYLTFLDRREAPDGSA